MTQISETAHVVNLLSDYVLELLPGDESARVAAHISGCRDCRRALTSERNVGRLVWNTLNEVSVPGQGKLQQRMPPPPAVHGRAIPLLTFSPRLAAAGIMLILICSTLFLYLNQRPGVWTFASPTAWSTAVILTDTPTQTATREFAATVEQGAAPSPSNMAPAGENARDALAPEPALVPVPAAPLLH